MTPGGPFPVVPVSWGELIDKITILEIRLEHLREPEALANARGELALLQDVLAGLGQPATALTQLRDALAAVNRRLWDIEDRIRDKEAAQMFDAAFVELARAVYRNNDERARVKREINRMLNSGIVEEKLYPSY